MRKWFMIFTIVVFFLKNIKWKHMKIIFHPDKVKIQYLYEDLHKNQSEISHILGRVLNLGGII